MFSVQEIRFRLAAFGNELRCVEQIPLVPIQGGDGFRGRWGDDETSKTGAFEVAPQGIGDNDATDARKRDRRNIRTGALQRDGAGLALHVTPAQAVNEDAA